MKTGTPLRASLSRWRFDISELWSARHAELQGENIFLRGLNVGKACAAKLSRIPPMKFMRNRDFKASPGHCNGVIFYQLQYAAAKKKVKHQYCTERRVERFPFMVKDGGSHHVAGSDVG